MQDRPYFMQDKSWYEFDFDKGEFVLTDKAPDDAKRSLAEFYRTEKLLTQKEGDRHGNDHQHRKRQQRRGH